MRGAVPICLKVLLERLFSCGALLSQLHQRLVRGDANSQVENLFSSRNSPRFWKEPFALLACVE
jgi:hypothetical protein